MKELERYLVIDLECHIATKNGRNPYYLDRFQSHLARGKALLSKTLRGGSFTGNAHDLKDFDHSSAEIQASCVEYGFCHRFDNLYDVGEATRRLDAISLRLDTITKAMDTQVPEAIADLHDVIALQHGVQQALTEENMAKIMPKYREINARIMKLENNICREKVHKDSKIFKDYVTIQGVLQKPYVSEIRLSDPSDGINAHMIHPGTRSWLIERFHNFYVDKQKRLFFLAGKSGSGKTAMGATICKLYGSDVIANHFFNADLGDSEDNHMTGLIQSLAADMCRNFPEYLAYMDDTYGGTPGLLESQLSGEWQNYYNVLIKDPITAVFGSGPRASPGEEFVKQLYKNATKVLFLIAEYFPVGTCYCLNVQARREQVANCKIANCKYAIAYLWAPKKCLFVYQISMIK